MNCVRNAHCGPEPLSLRVLIAEDEALAALSLSDLLETEGYEISMAHDGAEALAEARRQGDALGTLVTDLNMPRMDGGDPIRALRAERPGLPVVVVPGSAPPGGAAELREYVGGHGPLVLLHRPIDSTGPVETLRRVVLPNPA